MSHKHNPPRQDRRGHGRNVIKPHAGEASVGVDGRKRKAVINDKQNGQDFDGGAGPEAGAGAGANGPPTTGPYGLSSW
jgi:hypothetical protein